MYLRAQITISSENKFDFFLFEKMKDGLMVNVIFQFLVSTYFLKLFKMACQPSRCISIGKVLSASNVISILVLASLSSSLVVNIISTCLPSVREYTINSFVFTCL